MAYLLEGIKVIDLAGFLAAPGAATLMADYGAEVIKVEPPGGDGYRRLHGLYETDYHWQLTSRNKQGMAIDITEEAGRKVLDTLLEDADVLIVNFRLDQLKKYDLSFERLHETFPRLILAQLTGYGNVGPDKYRRGYDSSAWFARSGILRLMKPQDGPPTFPAGGVGDHSTAMSLFAGILMALLKRGKEGVGSFVETSLIANGCWANGMQLQGAIAGFDTASLLEEKGRSPFAMVYETRDNRHIVLILTNPVKEWPELANALGHPEWMENARLTDLRSIMRDREKVRTMFTEVIGGMRLDDICLALDKYHLTFGVIESPMDVVQDAHLIENGVVVRTESEDPNFQWTIANPISISGEKSRPAIDPPAFGENTREILLSRGFTDDEINSLIERKIVFAGQPGE